MSAQRASELGEVLSHTVGQEAGVDGRGDLGVCPVSPLPDISRVSIPHRPVALIPAHDGTVKAVCQQGSICQLFHIRICTALIAVQFPGDDDVLALFHQPGQQRRVLALHTGLP